MRTADPEKYDLAEALSQDDQGDDDSIRRLYEAEEWVHRTCASLCRLASWRERGLLLPVWPTARRWGAMFLSSGVHTYNGIVAPTPILPLQSADAKPKTPNPDDATVTCSFAK